MSTENRIFIAGAGPVGLVAAAELVRRQIPVTVFEASETLSEESRASTFHPPTLDMLDDLGVAADLIVQGLKAPRFQYRSKQDGIIAAFDFSAIADVTRHPYRLQAEQFKLTRIIHAKLQNDPNFSVVFGRRVCGVKQDEGGVAVQLALADGVTEERYGRWLIGADGARSDVRSALGIEFEGFTWPEQFLVVSTPFDFHSVIPALDSVSYVADPDRWHFFLKIPGHWRVMFPIVPDMTAEAASDPAFARTALATVAPGTAGCDIDHVTLYRVHQRVAKTFRLGRVLLAGDAAHINNPLGGMGMNGGIHDAVNLANRLARVWHGDLANQELDRYDFQRRRITLEYVQKHTIQNKRNLEARDQSDRDRFRTEMRLILSEAQKTHDYLERVSMIASLKRAAEIG
jgi:3-(3-hydroxy-phenyl)propionate hydroxylase